MLLSLFFLSTAANACRHHVNSFLKKNYKTLDEAEDDLGVNYFSAGLEEDASCNTAQSSPENAPSTPAASHEFPTPLSPVFSHSPYHNASEQTCYGDVISNLIKLL